MTRLALATALLLAVLAIPAAAQAPSVLTIGTAKAVATKTADKVRRDLKSEGATKSAVPGCWRNNARQVSCFFSVYGYDSSDDFRWKCMLRIVVKLRHHPTPAKGRYKFRYGHAVCG